MLHNIPLLYCVYKIKRFMWRRCILSCREEVTNILPQQAEESKRRGNCAKTLALVIPMELVVAPLLLEQLEVRQTFTITVISQTLQLFDTYPSHLMRYTAVWGVLSFNHTRINVKIYDFVTTSIFVKFLFNLAYPWG